jgi:hypothetical protein
VRRVLLTGAATVALVTGLAQPSHATLMLSLSDGITTQTLTDVGGTGMLIFNNALGAFTTNVTTALSTPVLGSIFQPILDLNSIDVANRATSGGTLTLAMTDTDFVGSATLTQFFSSIGGTLSAGSINYSTFLDCSNTAFGKGQALSSQSFTSTPFSGSETASAAGCNSPYSLTQIITLALPGGGFFSGDATLAVPEPSTLASFGAGLALLIGAGWLRRRNTML